MTQNALKVKDFYLGSSNLKVGSVGLEQKTTIMLFEGADHENDEVLSLFSRNL